MVVSITILILWVTYKIGKYALQQGLQVEANNKLKRNMKKWEKKNKKTS